MNILKKKKKTVLFVLDSYDVGGVTAFIRQYTTILKETNHTSVLIGRLNDLYAIKETFPHSHIVTIPEKINYSLKGRVFGAIAYIRFLQKTYSLYSIDIIHFSLTWSTLYAMCVRQTWTKKRIITFFGAYDLELASTRVNSISVRERIGDIFRHYLQFITLLFCCKIITFSEYARNLLLTHFSRQLTKKIVIIPGFVEMTKGVVFSERLNKEKRDAKTFTVLNLGRAEPRKGIDLILKTASLIKEKGLPIEFIIVSPVQYIHYYRLLEIYQELDLGFTVRFVHGLNESQKKELFKTCDLFMMPSKDLETFGMTLLESMSYGLPVIGSANGAIKEILGQVDPKAIIHTQTPEAYAQKIINYYKQSQSQKRKKSRFLAVQIRREFPKKLVKKRLMDIYLC